MRRAGFTSLLSCQAVFSLSIDITNLHDAKEDRNVHGWSPNWLIASHAWTLRSQLKITCHLLCYFSPSSLVSFSGCLITVKLCVCVHMHGQRVSVGSWGSLNSSFHGMRKKFCSYPVSPMINSALLHVRWKSEATVENLQGILYSFKCNVIIAHCRGPWTALQRFRSLWALSPKNISITLCCMSGGNQYQMGGKHSGHIFTPLNVKCCLSSKP